MNPKEMARHIIKVTQAYIDGERIGRRDAQWLHQTLEETVDPAWDWRESFYEIMP